MNFHQDAIWQDHAIITQHEQKKVDIPETCSANTAIKTWLNMFIEHMHPHVLAKPKTNVQGDVYTGDWLGAIGTRPPA